MSKTASATLMARASAFHHDPKRTFRRDPTRNHASVERVSPLDRLQPLARIHRNRQRLPSNGSIERAQSTAPQYPCARRDGRQVLCCRGLSAAERGR